MRTMAEHYFDIDLGAVRCGARRQAPPWQHHDGDDDDDQGRHYYSEHDRDEMRELYQGQEDHLPPGVAQRDQLPPGLEM